MKAIIIAGGKGTRLSSVAKNIPKAMVMISGKPLLAYQIELLKKNNCTDITIVINHLGHMIKQYGGDGSRFGVRLKYFEEHVPLGTAGALKKIKGLTDAFLVVYGDLLLNMDFKRMIRFHRKKGGIATLTVHPNLHPYDSDLIEIDEQEKITAMYSKPHSPDLLYHNLVNAAVYILDPKIIDYIPDGIASDFGKDIFPCVIKGKRDTMFGYRSHEYMKDIGTPDRFTEAEHDIERNIFKKGTFGYKRPAVFIDRDGVINKEIDHIRRVSEVELLPHVIEGLKIINKSGYLAIVISNQPQVAKGFCEIGVIRNINKKIEVLLGEQKVKLDRIYFCPHYPEKGFPGENPLYKIRCSCRKPGIGMIKQAVKDFNIDLSKSVFIGDQTMDALTAKNAGIRFIGVKTGYGCQDGKYHVRISRIYRDLNEAVRHMLLNKI